MTSVAELFDSLSAEQEEKFSGLTEAEKYDEAIEFILGAAAEKGIETSAEQIIDFLGSEPAEEPAISVDQFKELRASISAEMEQEVKALMLSDADAGLDKIVEIAASKDVTLTAEDAAFLLELSEADAAEDDEDENVELDAVALTAVAGGRRKAFRRRRRSASRGSLRDRKAMAARMAAKRAAFQAKMKRVAMMKFVGRGR